MGIKQKEPRLLCGVSTTLNVFAVGENGELLQYYTVLGSGTWAVYEALNSSTNLTGGVSGVKNGSTLELFAVKTNGDVAHIQKPSSGPWAVYTVVSGGASTEGRPSVIWGSSSANIFAVAADGSLRQHSITFGSGSWNTYTVLGNTMGLTGGTSSTQSGVDTHVFASDKNGKLVQMTAVSGSWSSFDVTSATTGGLNSAGTPGLIWGSSAVDVFTRTTSGTLQQFHTTLGSGTWTRYTNLSSADGLIGGVDASLYGSTTEVFGVNVP